MVYLLKIAMFNSYVKLPDGKCSDLSWNHVLSANWRIIILQTANHFTQWEKWVAVRKLLVPEGRSHSYPHFWWLVPYESPQNPVKSHWMSLNPTKSNMFNISLGPKNCNPQRITFQMHRVPNNGTDSTASPLGYPGRARSHWWGNSFMALVAACWMMVKSHEP